MTDETRRELEAIKSELYRLSYRVRTLEEQLTRESREPNGGATPVFALNRPSRPASAPNPKPFLQGRTRRFAPTSRHRRPLRRRWTRRRNRSSGCWAVRSRSTRG
jgi:hypothetical protein